MSFRYYPSIFNEINNKIRQSTSYVDCKLMFFDGSLVVNFAKLVAAGFWWTRFNNFFKKSVIWFTLFLGVLYFALVGLMMKEN